jgi:hypothetical protein
MYLRTKRFASWAVVFDCDRKKAPERSPTEMIMLNFISMECVLKEKQ